MIAVDTSALMAIALNEPTADDCISALISDNDLLISAVSLAEALGAADQRSLAVEMAKVVDRFGFNVIPVTEATAQTIATVYRSWGKGNHPAALNLGDCFAYQVAIEYSCPCSTLGKTSQRQTSRSPSSPTSSP